MNNLGCIYANRNEIQPAEKWFEAAVKRDPNHAPALSNLGAVRAQQNRAADAQRLMEQARKSRGQKPQDLGKPEDGGDGNQKPVGGRFMAVNSLPSGHLQYIMLCPPSTA